MDERVDVSVVIVNWNTRQLLLDVVASLKATTHRARTEIIVVDNASGDDSVTALRREHPDVTVITNPDNFGFARANNIGFRHARAEAFCLVNTDVIAHDGVVDRLWERLRSDPGIGAVGPRTVDGDGRLRRNVRRFPSLRNALGDHLWLRRLAPRLFPGRSLPASTFERAHDAEVLSGCFLLVRRRAVEEVGPLDEGFFFYGEDTDWARRFHDAGWRCVYDPEARAVHFGGGSTDAYPVRYRLAMEQADLRYWRKHHPLPEVACYVAIRVLHHVAVVVGWSARWLLQPHQRSRAAARVAGSAASIAWLLAGRGRA